jgi:hypothetical protein
MTTVLLAINSSIWQATPGPFKASSARQNVVTCRTFDFQCVGWHFLPLSLTLAPAPLEIGRPVLPGQD